ncbi:hypothetical protein BOTCAL_0692g00010 [Botryotinia calthae]|uniref:Uncharacterized protein n=1 Tax=Botryotinia calthae TaxID=38488 RepID=A0A4Y8CJR2_9HELO|nr:hypothetical protein BOTCAL_0692g00010 [Botryotinia calthae]
MAKTASGHIDCDGSNVWTGTFKVDGTSRTFTGDLSQSIKFGVNQATASYEGDDSFNGTATFSGVIGDKTIKIKMGKVTITGEISAPIDKEHAVHGSVTWIVNSS